jgi:rhodanese-related sulfurtransferase
LSNTHCPEDDEAKATHERLEQVMTLVKSKIGVSRQQLVALATLVGSLQLACASDPQSGCATCSDALLNSGGSSQGGTTSTAPATGGLSGVATGGSATSGGASSIGGSLATGGSATSGGASASGGASSIGGTPASGGNMTSGGNASTGGTPASGGKTTSGGAVSTGGSPASGGKATTGGNASTGGTPASGGKASTGGTSASGGASTAKGGTTATAGTAGAGTARSCPPPVVTGTVAKALVASGAVLLDVREPSEFAADGLPGAINIPVGSIKAREAELTGRTIVTYCKSGSRSATASAQLCADGFDVYNLGAMANWSQ